MSETLHNESSVSPAAAATRDPSSFYRLNEELGAELRRLEASGALDGLKDLLRAGAQELLVASVRRGQGLEELVGVLGPGASAEPGPLPAPLPPALDATDPVACDCGPSGGESAPAPAPARAGWDSDSYLATRSRFTVLFPDGQARELYMPDHVCPLCLNDESNWIEHCGRVCASCDFRW